MGLSPIAVTQSSDMAPVLSKECLDIQVNIECEFSLKCVRDMIKAYSQTVNMESYTASLKKYSVTISRSSKNIFGIHW